MCNQTMPDKANSKHAQQSMSGTVLPSLVRNAMQSIVELLQAKIDQAWLGIEEPHREPQPSVDTKIQASYKLPK